MNNNDTFHYSMIILILIIVCITGFSFTINSKVHISVKSNLKQTQKI